MDDNEEYVKPSRLNRKRKSGEVDTPRKKVHHSGYKRKLKERSSESEDWRRYSEGELDD